MAKRVTIKDVASAADVSVTTVSIVLNGKGSSVPKSTQERIFEAASNLNYVPNHSARSLVTGETKTVGIIVPSITNFFFAELVRLLQKKFSMRGYDIMLSNNEERADNDLKYIDLLASRNVDAIIFTPSAETLLPQNTQAVKDLIDKLTIPCLFLDRYISNYEHISVDNASSTYLLADYLIGCGHTKIGVISGPQILNSSANRLKGVRERYLKEDIYLADESVYFGQYDIETGEKATEKFVQDGVTAIFTFSDMQAYGVYKKLKQLGKRVPEDISVVGFDDNVYSSLLDKPLTTMRQPLEELAEDTVNSTLDLIAGRPLKKICKRTATLIKRESVKMIKN